MQWQRYFLFIVKKSPNSLHESAIPERSFIIIRQSVILFPPNIELLISSFSTKFSVLSLNAWTSYFKFSVSSAKWNLSLASKQACIYASLALLKKIDDNYLNFTILPKKLFRFNLCTKYVFLQPVFPTTKMFHLNSPL